LQQKPATAAAADVGLRLGNVLADGNRWRLTLRSHLSDGVIGAITEASVATRVFRATSWVNDAGVLNVARQPIPVLIKGSAVGENRV
jgi:hypothetical protein